MQRLLFLAMVAGCGFDVAGGTSDGPDVPRDGGGGDAGVSDAGVSDGSGSDATGADAMRATVTYIQGGTAVSGGTTQAVLVLGPSMTGDLCVLGIGVQGSNVASVTDTSSSTYSTISSTGGLHVYVAANMTAGATNTITITFQGSAGFTGAVACYRGLATVSPVDAMSASSGMGNSMDSGGTSPTLHAHDLIVGIAASDGAMTANGGLTMRTNSTTSMIADRQVDATASYHATATSGVNISWAMAVLALKAAD